MDPEYSVMGYDKDAGVHETLCSSLCYEYIVEVARCIIHYHTKVRELCRMRTGEPFDWFVVACDDEPVMIFTEEEPDGSDIV